ncbi:MAG: hypothetical protein QNK16_04230 [Woeseiaceae bacterium]|nr:hypothetical protein [Woeseiaceae bacterium]MDX2607568.1 hypothetical protein [Woeseiaceae bacterium]
MTIDRSRIFQAFKYVVYLLLAMNIYWFFAEEVLAAKTQFPNGVGIKVMIEAYAATIDTAAWVVLLLMFELETYVLEDEQFTRPVTWSLHTLRAICYAFIVYAFYGYIAYLLAPDCMTPLASVTDRCALAWLDVINSAVWLLVVTVLEIDVRLQERHRYEGAVLYTSNAIKFVLYAMLFLAAIYWGFNGGFVHFWDAFLWLVAFIFIELNVFEWHKEEHEKAMATAAN